MTPSCIKRLRGSIGATQADLGRMLNANAVTVSRWENGHATPDRWTNVVLHTIENHLHEQPARAAAADTFLRADLWLHALAVLISPSAFCRKPLKVEDK
jgi:transcriptional regulator with XRE-family HTH domain